MDKRGTSLSSPLTNTTLVMNRLVKYNCGRQMELTLQQAATQLGKSVRQVRYMIKEGKLRARKEGAVWRIDSAGLPVLSSAQAEASYKKERVLRAAVEEALTQGDSPQKQRYSLRNVHAIAVGLPLHAKCSDLFGATHATTETLYRVLEHVACGCHRFVHVEKVDAYRAARDEASRCACALVVLGTAPALDLLGTVENDLLPSISGLIRRYERRPRA